METSVESMQAMTVYMLLQAQDTDTIVKNDVKFLLAALRVSTYFHRPLSKARGLTHCTAYLPKST